MRTQVGSVVETRGFDKSRFIVSVCHAPCVPFLCFWVN